MVSVAWAIGVSLIIRPHLTKASSNETNVTLSEQRSEVTQ
jgi:hypothetical protein